MKEQQSIKDTLNVIRKALEDDDIQEIDKKNDINDILLLDRLVEDDGTINIIEENIVSKKDITQIVEKKIDNILQESLDKWLDKNLPRFFEKYFNKKKI